MTIVRETFSSCPYIRDLIKYIAMRSYLRLFLIVVLGLVINTNSNAQKDNTEKKEAISWDEAKDAFHEVMAGTFHPAQEGDFKPLKMKYKELIKAAKVWKKATLPKSLEGKMLAEKLELLYVDSSGLGELVKNKASDEDLKKAIYALHDVFHEIVGMCEH